MLLLTTSFLGYPLPRSHRHGGFEKKMFPSTSYSFLFQIKAVAHMRDATRCNSRPKHLGQVPDKPLEIKASFNASWVNEKTEDINWISYDIHKIWQIELWHLCLAICNACLWFQLKLWVLWSTGIRVSVCKELKIHTKLRLLPPAASCKQERRGVLHLSFHSWAEP